MTGTTGVPQEAASAVARADDVITILGGASFSGADTAGDTAALIAQSATDVPSVFIPGDDMEIVAARINAFAVAGEVHSQVLGPTGFIFPAEVNYQLTTRTGYTDPGGDGDLPAGTMWHDHLIAHPAYGFEDETNGTGGLGHGDGHVIDAWVPPEHLDVESTEEVDEGVSIQQNLLLVGVPDNTVLIRGQVQFWVRDR